MRSPSLIPSAESSAGAAPATPDPSAEICPACGAPLSTWRSVRASEPALAQSRFALRRCVECGSAVTIGQAPEELHEVGAYRPGVPRLHRAARPLLAAFDRQRLSLVRDLITPPARLLDAGAGRGRFVLAARAAGFDAFGIEPSVRGASAARELGVPVQQVSIEGAQLDGGSLDAVTLWHVLEHLDEPGRALSRIGDWLRPGGGLVVGVPNLVSLQALLGGERWYHLDVPRHRIHLTPDGLHALLRSHGFRVLSTRHLLLEHNPFGMWQSIVNRFTGEPSYLYNLLKRNVPLRSPDLAITAVGLALAPVAAAMEVIAGAAKRGGTIAVLARRE